MLSCKKIFDIRESNPGQLDGNELGYHYPNVERYAAGAPDSTQPHSSHSTLRRPYVPQLGYIRAAHRSCMYPIWGTYEISAHNQVMIG